MKTKGPLAKVTAAVSLVVVAAAFSTQAIAAITPGTITQVKSLVTSSTKIMALSSQLSAKLASVGTDNAAVALGIPTMCESLTSCVFGDPAATTSVVLMGDSHARMWLPAIAPRAVAAHVRLILLAVNGCLVLGGMNGPSFGGCGAHLASEITLINKLKPRSVLLTERTTSNTISDATWKAGMLATLRALAPSKAKLAIIGDVQAFGWSVPACLASYPTAIQKCSVPNPNRSVPGHESQEKSAARAVGAKYVDPTPWMCAKRCSPVIGSFIAYWDSNHVTASYASYLARVMGTALAPYL